MTVTPAYGRDYKSQAAVKADWKAGKDFIVADVMSPHAGRYVNNQDFPSGLVMARYARNTKIVKVQ